MGIKRAAVSAGHEQTAEAAATILRAGGNAFDAAIGAFFMACVAEPVLASLGGGGFLLAHTEADPTRLFDFFSQTPQRKRPVNELDFYPISVDFGSTRQEFHIGRGAMATPGCVRGMFAVHRQLGYMPMSEIVQPAVSAAREGIPVSALQAYVFALVEPIFLSTPSIRKIYARPNNPDAVVLEGDLIRLPAFADTLEVLAIEGDDLFYRGEIAQRIDEMCADCGHLQLADLQAYEAIVRKPFSINYRNLEIVTNPPPSAGGILIGFALKLLNSVDVKALGFGSGEYLHLLATVMEMTNQARVEATIHEGQHYPDTATLLDKDYLQTYHDTIKDRASAHRGTTHLNITDKLGNVVSMTVSNGEGCGHIVPGTDILMNNMLGEEDLNPGGFHRWYPNQRMSSMMAPTVVHYPDGRVIATGSGGSNRIRTAVLQALVNLIDFNFDCSTALNLPRIHHEAGTLYVEGGFASADLEFLLAQHPNSKVWEHLNFFFGGAHTLIHSESDMDGSGDPRRGGVFIEV
ncbi:gamma-glutamyltransferase [Pseudomonadota bacterium]